MQRRHVMQYQNYLLAYAKSQGPFDPLTRFTQHLAVQAVLNLLYIPFIPIQIVSTASLGCISSLTLGIPLILLSALWLPVVGGVVGSSWIWINVPATRPFLLVPGLMWAFLARAFAACTPEMGEWDARATKQAICESWPHSYHIVKMDQDPDTE